MPRYMAVHFSGAYSDACGMCAQYKRKNGWPFFAIASNHALASSRYRSWQYWSPVCSLLPGSAIFLPLRYMMGGK